MKTSKLLQLLKQGYFVVPLYLLQLKEKLALEMNEFLFMVYLINQGDQFFFDPGHIASDFGISVMDVMSMISLLTDKHFIEVKVCKNDKGIMEEHVDLTLFYEKVTLLLVEEINLHQESDDPSSIYEVFETEFGRTLSPMEYEIIKAWIDGNMPRELIIRALKEATYNGVANLRYIDKILYEWDKKGFKKAEDVDKHQQVRRDEKKEKPKVESFDYNWFDDDEGEK